MKKFFSALLISITLAACSHPTERTAAPDMRPGIAFQNVPATAMVYVDGLEMGMAGDYDGKKQSLTVIKGTHLIEIRKDGETLLSRKIYVAGDSVTILRP
ncbi:hypothetical protein [Aestuariispira ectoiniformans]|uniref:hypothetical protein n=1 Tax=Aestuariispira ectoiniformans TaxID=2775080 RepID=UPI00223BE486|nr:hypothetical protein [Aestuariispira ectoiniformans]